MIGSFGIKIILIHRLYSNGNKVIITECNHVIVLRTYGTNAVAYTLKSIIWASMNKYGQPSWMLHYTVAE